MSDGWNIIKNNDDIEHLLEEYCGFHDSCICKADYVSGASVNEDGAMIGSSAETAKLNVNFKSQMVLKTLQLQFIGLRRMNLIGYEENYFSDISSCYLSMDKGYIVWANNDWFDSETPCQNKLLSEPMNTFIVADKLQWRFVDANNI
jgi:hypothetical protein